MTGCEFGDVVLIEYEFTDHSASKMRPAVIVSSVHYNKKRPDLVLMPISSRVRPALLFGEVLVREWQAAGLVVPGIVKPIFITEVQQAVRQRLGRLQEVDRSTLEGRIREILSDS